MPQNKTSKTPEKKYYTVEIDVLIPATVKYKILAESPQLAIEESVRTNLLERPTLKLTKMRRLKVRVYNWGTNMLQFTQTM